MSLKEKFLSKSNSYTYYKERNEYLEKENEELQKELEKLKEEKETTLSEDFYEKYPVASGFCNWNYIKYYFREDFEEKLLDVTSKLDKDSKYRYKLILLRALAVGLIRADSLYFPHEQKQQEKFLEFRKEHSGPNMINGYTYYGKYNLHAFIDLNLTDKDKEFLKNKDIIDAGAFTGDTSIPLSPITNKQIYAFEPFEDSFEGLKKNIAANDIENIIPIKKSLGNINGERNLYLAGENYQGISSNPNAREYDHVLKVEEITVDRFVEENNLDVGYITIDIEGAEKDLLEGALNTIKTQRPILSISIYHKVNDFFDIIPWVANLDLGYEFNVIKEQPWPFLADTVVQCRPKELI